MKAIRHSLAVAPAHTASLGFPSADSLSFRGQPADFADNDAQLFRAPSVGASCSESNSHLYAVSRIHRVEQRTRPSAREETRYRLVATASLLGVIASRATLRSSGERTFVAPGTR